MAKLSVSTLIDGSSVVATANYPFTADYFKPVSVQAVWTATTASFSIKLQYSNDNTTWNDFTSATAISDASGNVTWDIGTTKDGLYWRVLNTRTSGTLTTLKVYLAQVER
jgi:hypothetical protein